jgi:hypothetical protein
VENARAAGAAAAEASAAAAAAAGAVAAAATIAAAAAAAGAQRAYVPRVNHLLDSVAPQELGKRPCVGFSLPGVILGVRLVTCMMEHTGYHLN